MTDQEIARRGGLGVWEVAALTHSVSWTGIGLDTMQRYLKGCGVDFCNVTQMKRVEEYRREQSRLYALGRSTWRYLKRSPDWQAKYQPLVVAYLKYIKTL